MGAPALLAFNTEEKGMLTLPTDMDARLATLRKLPKFGPEEPSPKMPVGYVGYLPEEHRPAAEARINALIDLVQADIRAHPDTAWLKQQINETFDWFELSDTEDRERCALYLEDVLKAVGVPAEHLDINDWLEPFDPASLGTKHHLED